MDLNELVLITTADAHARAFLKDLTDAFARFSKPIIAAVVGFAVSPSGLRPSPPPPPPPPPGLDYARRKGRDFNGAGFPFRRLPGYLVILF
jgi:hypothetical protein